jgi:hypothetical protein
MRRYSINSLTESKCMKIMYDDKKEYIDFEITDIDKLTPQNIIEMKKKLEIINTKLALLWRDILDLLTIVNVNDIINKDPNYLVKIKQHLKFGFLESGSSLCIHYKNIPLYKLHFPFSVSFALVVNTKKYITDYKTKKVKIIEALKVEEKYFRERIDISDRLDVIRKHLNHDAFLYLDSLKVEEYEWVKSDDCISTVPQIIEFNYDAMIEELNKIPENASIKINLMYENYKFIEKISKIYDKIKHKGLRTFFENVNKNGFALGIYLTDIAVPNIQFEITNEYLKPQSIHESLKKVHAMYFDYHMNNFKRMLGTNNFDEVVVDDNGNIIDIKPIVDNMMDVFLLHNKRLLLGADISPVAEIIVNWNLQLI